MTLSHTPKPEREVNWLQACLLLLLMLFNLPAFAQKTPDPVPDPTVLGIPAMNVTRTPSPMVAGQPFTIKWSTTSPATVEYNCTSNGGYVASGSLSGTSGTITGLASASWVGRDSDCTWLADNGEKQRTYAEHVQTTGPALPPNPVNNAKLVSQSIPSTMISGQSYRVQVMMQNTGNTTWVAGEYKLGTQNPQDNTVWAIQRVELGGNIAPGTNANFDFTVTAPANITSATAVNMQWRMVQEFKEWFGDYSTSVPVSVGPAPKAATLTVTRTPATLTATQPYRLQWTATNATSVTRVCTSSGTGYTDNSTLPVSGDVTATASAAWVGYPSSCTWTAISAGGNKQVRETVTTNAAPPPPPSTNSPTITVTRAANPMQAGQTYNLQWSSTYAANVKRVCTSSGTGYVDNSTLASSGNVSITASSNWVGYPSACKWTATAQDGRFVDFSETVTTNAAPPPTTPDPTITVTRVPATMTAGKTFTLSWHVSNAKTLTRTCVANAGGFVSDGAMPFDASGNGSTLPALADVNWVNKPSSCTWVVTASDGRIAKFTETMTTLAAPTGPVVTYIHTDGLGSVVARTNEKGEVISRTRYEPYGATAGGDTPTIGFTGHVNDADTGLTYMQQRYYDPVAGRFMSVDPVLTDEETGESFNHYDYANNNPYKYIDPDGRQNKFSLIVNILKTIFKAEAKQGAKAGAQGAAKGAAKAEAKVVESAAKKPPNPAGQNGKADHQEKVQELTDKAKSEARPGEEVLQNKMVAGHDSKRIPDVQIRDADGKTRKVLEAERKPNSARNVKREAEYDRLGIEHETHPVGK